MRNETIAGVLGNRPADRVPAKDRAGLLRVMNARMGPGSSPILYDEVWVDGGGAHAAAGTNYGTPPPGAVVPRR